MSNSGQLLVSHTMVPAQLPVFTCSLAPRREALQLAREAIDELRALDPTSIVSNVKSRYVSPWDSHMRNPKFAPLCEAVVTVSRFVSKMFLTADIEALNMDYFVKDCWGMIYESSDHTLKHNHYPAELSCAIYLEADDNCAPIIFDGNISVQPVNDLLVLFPGILNHEVPETSGRRVVVSMNLFKTARHQV
jgi:hypothetical protein